MKRYVLLNLRTAVNTDFADALGNKKIGAVYFCQNSIGIIETKINYFSENTDMLTFKQLYAKGQIFVIANPSEAETTTTCDCNK